MWQTISGRIIIGLALLMVLGLQYSYWFGENGYQQRQVLQQQIRDQQDINQTLTERNRILAAEVYDLKNGAEAVEEYARLDLGLIKPNETFVQMSMINGTYQLVYLDPQATVQPADGTMATDEDANP